MIVFYIFFYLALYLLLHSYILYPISIWFLSIISSKSYNTDNNAEPPVSILISVFNEEKVIEKTIRNFLNCNYDSANMEIIIGSDKSTDKTNEILMRLSSEIPNLKFHLFNERRGKSQVLNDLVSFASADILIFSDANTIYDKDAIKKLVKYYTDPSIGGVSGKLVLKEHNEATLSASQEKVYWDFETWLKGKEGSLGILIGANGGIYSIRKELFSTIPAEYPIMDDFFISLKVLESKKSFLYCSEAIAEEYVAPSVEVEFSRKIRNNSIMMSTIKPIKKLLNFRFGLVSYALWSHKIIRWFSPLLLLILFISNLFLINKNSFYEILFYLQVLFYLSALAGYLLEKMHLYFKPLNLVYYFVMTNTAMLIGIIKFLQKSQTSFWQSTARN